MASPVENSSYSVSGQRSHASRRLLAGLERITSDLCQTIICNSPSVYAHLQRQAISPQRLRVIPHGVDLARFRPAVSQRSTATQTVLFIGRLHAEKGIASLAKAWPTVLRQCPAASLWVVGEGPLRHLLEPLDAVRCLGPRDDVPTLLHHADLVVIPSQTEGFSLVAAEAMACGRPIVATRAGGLVDLLHNERTALLVDVDDAPALAQAMVRMPTTPALAETLGRAAASAAQQLDVRHMIYAHHRLYLAAALSEAPGATRSCEKEPRTK